LTARDGSTVLRVEHLTMRFGGLVAVDDLSFEVQRGTITALIGPNGAGKTTVFNCITGFYRPTEGRLALQRGDPALWQALEALTDSGQRGVARPQGALFLLERMPDYLVAQRARVARTFQNIRLFAGMTVLENLLVAQHNPLMLASGYTVLGLLGLPPYRSGTAVPRRAGRGIESPRERRTQRAVAHHPRRMRHVDALDRARYVRGDEYLRPRRRARLWRQDCRRRARSGPQ
jgi:ABC-type branched-subunit amino acid transport system ATPase component